MKTEVKIPEVGESVREALLSQWYSRDGDFVRKGEILFIIETDKVTLEVVAEADGILKILVAEGATVPVGAVVGTIETEGAPVRVPEKPLPPAREAIAAPAGPEQAGSRPAALPEAGQGIAAVAGEALHEPLPSGFNAAPSALQMAAAEGVDLAKVHGSGPGGRITRGRCPALPGGVFLAVGYGARRRAWPTLHYKPCCKGSHRKGKDPATCTGRRIPYDGSD